MDGTSNHTEVEAELRAANEQVYKHSLELARLKKELETANAKQENLLHFISHEVKGYLTRSVAAFSGIAEGDYGIITPEAKKLAEAALRETRKGVETVMDILDAGNLKTGAIKLAHKPFDLRTSVEGIIDSYRGAAANKHLELTVSIEPGNYAVVGDEAQLRQHVIDNLIDNAITYTPQGAVEVSLSRKGNTIVFSVRDSGIGLTDEDKAHLFTEGGRGADSTKINVHSTGYGLFIAKSIIDAHGGRIWAESPGRGKGSTFIVELPASSISQDTTTISQKS
jgi:signal transduction histidine kinase